MADLLSNNWIDKDGKGWTNSPYYCKKHNLELNGKPCLKCVDENDPDIEISLTSLDRVVLDFEGCCISDLFPDEFEDFIIKNLYKITVPGYNGL